MSTVSIERDLAMTYESPRADKATHLRPMIDTAPKVWALGYLARNAVVALYPEVPRDPRRITDEPYPGLLAGVPKVFVSRYLSHIEFDEVRRIVERFAAFFNA